MLFFVMIYYGHATQSAKGLEWEHVCLVNFFTDISKIKGAAKGLRHMLTMEVVGVGIWGGVEWALQPFVSQ